MPLFLRLFFELNLVLTALFILLLGLREFVKLRPKEKSQLNLFLLISALAAPLVFFILPAAKLFPVVEKFVDNRITHQIWSTPQVSTEPFQGGFVSAEAAGIDWPWFLAMLALASILIGISFFIYQSIKTFRTSKNSFLWKTLGGIEIRLFDSSISPYSFCTWNQFVICLPSDLVADLKKTRLIIAHECNHHRLGDTRSVYFLELLRAIFWINPFVHRLVELICEQQEAACDEMVLNTLKVNEVYYASTLIEFIEEHFNRTNFLRVGATRGFLGHSYKQLKRRIHNMKSGRLNKKPVAVAAIAIVGLIGLSGFAFASQRALGFRSIEQSEVAALLSHSKSEIPIDLNREVVKWLNHFIRSAESRKALRAAIARGEKYKPQIVEELVEQDLPMELFAVPLVESSFRNLPQRFNPNRAAGLWQFIPGTARRYKLRVDQTVDERLAPKKAGRAALQYLQELHLVFNDWRLALMAYNAGENRIKEGIMRHKTRNPWELQKKGIKTDRGYLAKVMASAIILRHPKLAAN